MKAWLTLGRRGTLVCRSIMDDADVGMGVLGSRQNHDSGVFAVYDATERKVGTGTSFRITM